MLMLIDFSHLVRVQVDSCVSNRFVLWFNPRRRSARGTFNRSSDKGEPEKDPLGVLIESLPRRTYSGLAACCDSFNCKRTMTIDRFCRGTKKGTRNDPGQRFYSSLVEKKGIMSRVKIEVLCPLVGFCFISWKSFLWFVPNQSPWPWPAIKYGSGIIPPLSDTMATMV